MKTIERKTLFLVYICLAFAAGVFAGKRSVERTYHKFRKSDYGVQPMLNNVHGGTNYNLYRKL